MERDPPRRAMMLLELLLVVVIMVVLALWVLPRLAGRSDSARVAAAKSDLATLGLALDKFDIDNQRYPTSNEGLTALITQPAGTPQWAGPYLQTKHPPKDPWGNAYQYLCPGTQPEDEYDLFSFGPDRMDGGGDDIHPGQP